MKIYSGYILSFRNFRKQMVSEFSHKKAGVGKIWDCSKKGGTTN